MNESDDALDIITLIAVLVLFVPIMVYCTIPYLKGDVGGFGIQIEKTALQTEREIVPQPTPFTTSDALLMLLVADNNAPEPKKVRLDMGTPLEIVLDASFMDNRLILLPEAYAAMPVNHSAKLDLYAGPTGLRFWNVHS
ncbi:hypothetical protein [Cohnella fermenti]|uniref:Uncharacterized protein n=1 Tax=Cohnella fermenti TaxID=2565925 RepID=A0A4S4BJD7_9BACL|nr:hypothetical protein [Cohnella fermenti]THF74763.1 hypothetical protein E6C55_24455 [Cohnella fermenti]